MGRVIAAMSGGVDSSVAAWLLCEQGHEVIGVFMRHGIDVPQYPSPESQHPSPESQHPSPESQHPAPVHYTDQHCTARCASPTEGGSAPSAKLASSATASTGQGCCSAADAADARRVADRLGIPLYVLNFEQQFERLVDYFVDEYAAGRTPNPCIKCNTWLKFGKLFEYANAIGAELVATGHYARLMVCADGQLGLFRAVDKHKDQSYVLFGVQRDLLPRLRFPLGELTKTEVRRLAQRLGMSVAQKPDSQEICFAPKGAHWRLVRQRRPALDTSGEIVDATGRLLGHHQGVERFTIGQRKGLGVALGRRQYVVRIEAESRRVVIGDKQQLARNQLTASDVNWLITPPPGELACKVKIRYRSPALNAVVTPLGERQMAVRFLEPCYAVTPGQAVVCYQHDQVLGGGWID